jgi:hypothetical protein
MPVVPHPCALRPFVSALSAARVSYRVSFHHSVMASGAGIYHFAGRPVGAQSVRIVHLNRVDDLPSLLGQHVE